VNCPAPKNPHEEARTPRLPFSSPAVSMGGRARTILMFGARWIETQALDAADGLTR
jgi:hypothetical protein